MASKCRKFEPNIFNKSKCQACFGAKDAHSAEALHNNKVGFFFFQIYNALCDTGVYIHACTIAVLTHMTFVKFVVYICCQVPSV